MNPIIQNEIQEYLRVKKEMKDLGIDCRVFNPVTPMLNLFLIIEIIER